MGTHYTTGDARVLERVSPLRIASTLDSAMGAVEGTSGVDRIRELLDKARDARGLSAYEAAMLLQIRDPELREELLAAAGEVKRRIYGQRVVMFAPLYLSDYCVNACRYCGYKAANLSRRSKLSTDEIRQEVRALQGMGHKRLALEFGEDPNNCPIEYVEDAIATVYSSGEGHGQIRRVNVNVAATTVEDYRRLKAAGIGTYILFQETYHPAAYKWAHPAGPKTDYLWHLTAMDRAMEAGIDDVGVGVLFGLYDWRFEVIAMLTHAEHLEATYGCGPHTMSVPRLRPSLGTRLDEFPDLVSEDDLLHVIAVLRLAVPYTGLILSTREDADFRAKALHGGISQISAGSCVGVGGYAAGRGLEAVASGEPSRPQFQVSDDRSVDQVVRELCDAGFVPSYCTACYRMCRTGERFMELAKSGEIQNVCLPNALLTLGEFAEDYASPETRAVVERCIRGHLSSVVSSDVRAKTEEWLREVVCGRRDLFF